MILKPWVWRTKGFPMFSVNEGWGIDGHRPQNGGLEVNAKVRAEGIWGSFKYGYIHYLKFASISPTQFSLVYDFQINIPQQFYPVFDGSANCGSPAPISSHQHSGTLVIWPTEPLGPETSSKILHLCTTLASHDPWAYLAFFISMSTLNHMLDLPGMYLLPLLYVSETPLSFKPPYYSKLTMPPSL